MTSLRLPRRLGRYLLLTTFRADGTPVATPVWCARDGNRLVIWTDAGSWKVQRIRKNPGVMVRRCLASGRPTSPPVTGTAVELAEADGPRVHRLLDRRYPLARRAHRVWLARRRARGDAAPSAGTFLAVRLDPAAARTIDGGRPGSG